MTEPTEMYQISELSPRSFKLCFVTNLNGEIYRCFCHSDTMTKPTVLYKMSDFLLSLSNHVFLPTLYGKIYCCFAILVQRRSLQ
jgi:hypothetical protein